MPRYLLLLIIIPFAMLSCWTNPSGAWAADRIEQAGDILPLGLVVAAVATTAVRHDAEGFWQYGKSEALTLSVSSVLKYAVSEERPNGGNHSFPSGHAALSFSSAEFLCKRYGWQYGLPAYAVASFVGYSRVESDNHYLHDVLAGAAIGIASSYLLTKTYEDLNVSAEVDKQYIGIRLSRRW